MPKEFKRNWKKNRKRNMSYKLFQEGLEEPGLESENVKMKSKSKTQTDQTRPNKE
jgi:hypothetical protein